MSCYFPLIGAPDGFFESGKQKYKFSQYQSQNPLIDRVLEEHHDYILVPCGKCLGCRLDQSKDWANRLMMELQYHDSAYFVTLTYDDAHIPVNDYVDQMTGEVCKSLSLCKRDFQLFMKRLRKHFPNDKIRFYACGEYGSTTFRPHYHAIIFGLHLDDLRFYKKSKEGFIYNTSDSFSECWSIYHAPVVGDLDDEQGWYEPLGHAVIGEVSWETCAYTARYVTKKLEGDDKLFYEFCNIEPPFTLMSRKPGIAYQYYLDHPDQMARDSFCLASGRKAKPPRYFDKKYDIDFPDNYAIMKEVRKVRGKLSRENELRNTDLSNQDYLLTKYAKKKVDTCVLRRSQV